MKRQKKLLKIVVVGILFLICTAAFSPKSGTNLSRLPNAAYGNYKAGMAAASNESYPEAIQYFQLALKAEPFFPEAYAYLGLSYENLGEMKMAEEYQRKAITQWPEYDFAHYNLGNALFKQNRLPESIESYKQALKINPKFVNALSNLGAAYLKNGKLDQAEKTLREALTLDPNHLQSKAHLAGVLFERGQYQEALPLYREFAEAHKKDAIARINLANCLLSLGQFEEAENFFKSVLEEHPDNFEALYGMGLSAYRQKKDSAATKFFNAALKTRPQHPKAMFYLANLQQRSGSKDSKQQAIATLQRLVAAHPNQVEAHFNLALLYTQVGRNWDSKNEQEIVKNQDTNAYERLQAELGKILGGANIPRKIPTTAQPANPKVGK